MAIKLICFDMDGVLVSTKDIHYQAFNRALKDYSLAPIPYEDHIKYFDGLPTKHKMLKYEQVYGTKIMCPKCVWNKKQLYTEELYAGTNFDLSGRDECIRALKKDYSVVVATNSIRSTTELILKKTGLINDVERFYCTDDVVRTKPHPEIYLKAMIDFKVSPKEVLIIEDSPTGWKAASASGAYVMQSNYNELTLEKIKNFIADIEKRENHDILLGRKINIVIPCAGAGSRFRQVGYTQPKPMIPVKKLGDKSMIQCVIDSIDILANYYFIIQKEHSPFFKPLLKALKPNCQVIEVDGITEGALCTVLKAKEFINNENELLVCNSDQYFHWNKEDFFYEIDNHNADGSILTFKATEQKWSFAKINNGWVEGVVEKEVGYSDDATVGLYHFKRGDTFVKYAEKMIQEQRKTRGEYYLCPIYNDLIKNGLKIRAFQCDKMVPLGTPEDLKIFEES